MPHEKGLTKNEVKTESKAEKSSPDKSGWVPGSSHAWSLSYAWTFYVIIIFLIEA